MTSLKKTLADSVAALHAEAEQDRLETAALWSDDEEEPLPMASLELAAEAAAFAAKALPILEAYAAHHGMEAALAFGARLSGDPTHPAATMEAAHQEIEASAKRNLAALSTAFGRDTAVAWLDRELSSTEPAASYAKWLAEKERAARAEKEAAEAEEKAKEEEKAWLRRASLMAMTGRGHY